MRFARIFPATAGRGPFLAAPCNERFGKERFLGTRFEHATHVVRAAALFASGLLIFLAVRRALVPSDFGAYGFYRGGALGDIAALPLHYAGQQACLDCHAEVGSVRAGGRHAGVSCEACHGPLALHASGDADAKPKELAPRQLCVTCHTKNAGKPAAFPQIVPTEHGDDAPCTACHQPHSPKIG